MKSRAGLVKQMREPPPRASVIAEISRAAPDCFLFLRPGK
jgi:hypothetical protein